MYNDERAGVGTHSRRASVEVKREFSFLLYFSSFSDDELDAGASRLPPARGNEKKKPDRFFQPVRFEIGDFGESRNPIFPKIGSRLKFF